MTLSCKKCLENDVITTHINSAGMFLLNYESFIPIQPFLFFVKSTGPILSFVALEILHWTDL